MSQIEDAIREAAARYNVDPEALVQVARIESGLNPNAKNSKSSAEGLFQFLNSTAKQYGLQDKRDVYQSADAGARLMADNAALLRNTIGREPTPGELYLAHQQGGAGAVKLLSNPTAKAADLVGTDAVTLNGGNPEMTAMDFANLWNGKMKPEDRFAGLMAQTPVQSDPYASPVPVQQYSAPGVGQNVASALGTTLNTGRGSGNGSKQQLGYPGIAEMSAAIHGEAVPPPTLQAPAASTGNPNAANAQAAQALMAQLMADKKSRATRGLTLGV